MKTIADFTFNTIEELADFPKPIWINNTIDLYIRGIYNYDEILLINNGGLYSNVQNKYLNIKIIGNQIITDHLEYFYSETCLLDPIEFHFHSQNIGRNNERDTYHLYATDLQINKNLIFMPFNIEEEHVVISSCNLYSYSSTERGHFTPDNISHIDFNNNNISYNVINNLFPIISNFATKEKYIDFCETMINF
jgi:hypothetical protein